MTAQRDYPVPFVPWAEIVPNRPRMTVDELEALPNDGRAYELIEGVLVRMPPGGGGASSIGYLLGGSLSVYVRANDLGRVTGEQGGYRLDPAHPGDTEVAPDVAFVRADRVPARTSPEFDQAWPLAPDLAVEVVSPSQYAPEMNAKAQFYLRFGARLVWVVWPRYKRVDVWHPGETVPTALGLGDVLDGEDVAPGFTYAVDDLFS